MWCYDHLRFLSKCAQITSDYCDCLSLMKCRPGEKNVEIIFSSLCFSPAMQGTNKQVLCPWMKAKFVTMSVTLTFIPGHQEISYWEL